MLKKIKKIIIKKINTNSPLIKNNKPETIEKINELRTELTIAKDKVREDLQELELEGLDWKKYNGYLERRLR